eukprot:TRINITY_DN5772_c0_g4_i2.p1 TRINITY_DN5772_c0_g4~~TRINITY_DN5772_c0_g4_i2.p1  ORF type:complete len:2172 (+),score=832.60 TRINITY_DN5772_c0_g4_i2:97-6612(+)
MTDAQAHEPEVLAVADATPEDLAEKVSDCVRDTYGRWRPERLDLFTDLSVEEGLSIDADSLLLECFCNHNLDWEGGREQMLHIAYLCESLLKDFLVRGATVTVVFFDSGRALWSRDPSKLLARDALYRHLSSAGANPAMPTVVRFPSWWCPEWRVFLKKSEAPVVLVNDGEQASVLSAHPDDVKTAQLWFRGLVVDVIHHHFHIGYTSRLVRKDNFIHGFVVRSSGLRLFPDEVLHSVRQVCSQLFDASHPQASGLAKEAACFPTSGSVPISKLVADGSFRVQLGATAVAAALKDGAAGEHGAALAKVWLLHLLLLPDVPLHWRAQELTELSQDSEDVSAYVTAAPGFSGACLKEAAKLLGQQTTAPKELLAPYQSGEFSDMWDSRLFRKLLGILIRNGDAMVKDGPKAAALASTWAAVAGEAGADGSLFPILPPVSGEAPPPSAHEKFGLSTHDVPLADPDELVELKDGLTPKVCGELVDTERPLSPTEMSQVTREVDDLQGWLQRSEKWETEDSNQAFLLDDLFRQFKGDTYDTAGLTQAMKQRLERRWQKVNQKQVTGFAMGARSMGGYVPDKRSIITRTDAARADRDEDGDDSTSPKGKKGWGQKQKGQPKETAADRIRREQAMSKAQGKKEKIEQLWANFYTRVEHSSSHPDRLERAASEIETFTKQVSEDLEVLAKVRTERIVILEKVWIKEAIAALEVGKKPNYQRAVALFRAVHFLVNMYFREGKALKGKIEAAEAEQAALDEQKAKEEAAKEKKKGGKKPKKDKADTTQTVEIPEYRPFLDQKQLDVCRHALVMLGLKENCRLLDKRIASFEQVTYEKEGRHKLPAVRPEAKKARITGRDVMLLDKPESTAHFQMRYMGHLMDRPVGTKDSRVQFCPDGWQKELLECVDRGESVLCTAPTSAGKTFISYYCMEKVLLESNENVCVYVAPTRALVNQVCCDIVSRWDKTYKAPGWSTFGILGGVSGGFDYVYPAPPLGGPFYAQILVTIPTVFEQVMLSPRYQKWAQNVKCVIFDEVHSIDQAGSGHLWERLLMLTRCQFVALSATIGNTENFRQWLEGTKEVLADCVGAKEAGRVKGVYHNKRWNDLQKYVYVPRTNEERSSVTTKTLMGPDFGKDNLRELHPFSCVSLSTLEERDEFPQDLPLVPRESIELFNAMRDSYETATQRFEGRYSDEEEAHCFRLERTPEGLTFRGRSGHFSGLRGLLKGERKRGKHAEAVELPTHPALPKDFTADLAATFDGDSVVWIMRAEDDLDVVVKRGDGKLRRVEVSLELPANVDSAVGSDGSLAPETFFKSDLIITQDRAREYEQNLKSELMTWVKMGKSRTLGGEANGSVYEMVRYVLDMLQKGRSACADAERIAEQEGDDIDTLAFVRKHLLDALVSVASQDRLPVIVFNFDEATCVDLAAGVAEELEAAEAVYRKSPEWRKKVQEQELKIKEHGRQLKLAASMEKASLKRSGGGNKGGDDDDGLGKDSRRKEKGGRDQESFKAEFGGSDLGAMVFNDEIPDFTFVRRERGEGLSKTDYDAMLAETKVLDKYDADSVPMKCLERGIGIHHNGMSAKYRTLVERLFRLRHLKVIIATETLALGIHSPCRTVLFAGDDVRLSTMQFRQMAGRAGRRGLDWVGNVVFLGVPAKKVKRLMTGALPTLRGHHPIDPALVLRFCLLHNHQFPQQGRERHDVDKQTVQTMARCISKPLFNLGNERCGEEFPMQLRLQYRYTMEYLVRQGFVTTDGKGLHLAGLTTRSLETQGEVYMTPSNLVFAALVKSGLFQSRQACGRFSREHPERWTGELLQVLAWFFTRNKLGWKQEVHRSHQLDPDVLDDECPHEVRLKPLRDIFQGAVAEALDKHNFGALRVFGKMVRRAAAIINEKYGRDKELPMTKVEFSDDAEKAAADPLIKQLGAEAVPYDARSPFVALAGLDDHFDCVEDLMLSLRSKLHLEEDSLPILDFVDLGRAKGCKDRYVQMNALVYDFKQTGHQEGADRAYIDEYNGVNQSNSWYILERFIRTLDNLTTAVEKMAPAWKDKEAEFRCSNPVCKNVRFTAKNGLYKCHSCEIDGRDSFQCPDCYASCEPCVIETESGTTERRMEHEYYRHVDDSFVQCLAGIFGDFEPLWGGLQSDKRDKHARRRKLEETAKKPKRPMLTKPMGRRGKRRPMHRRRR